MGSIVSNATPLVYLAKIGRLELLKRIFEETLIPEEVKRGVVDRGKESGAEDALIIEKAISEGWLKIAKAKPVEIPIKLEAGEIEAISLAKNRSIKEVLDEVSARTAAEMLALVPRGTIFVLLRALEEKEITFDEFLDSLKELAKQGFRLREEVYLEAVQIARKIAG